MAGNPLLCGLSTPGIQHFDCQDILIFLTICIIMSWSFIQSLVISIIWMAFVMLCQFPAACQLGVLDTASFSFFVWIPLDLSRVALILLTRPSRTCIRMDLPWSSVPGPFCSPVSLRPNMILGEALVSHAADVTTGNSCSQLVLEAFVAFLVGCHPGWGVLTQVFSQDCSLQPLCTNFP